MADTPRWTVDFNRIHAPDSDDVLDLNWLDKQDQT